MRSGTLRSGQERSGQGRVVRTSMNEESFGQHFVSGRRNLYFYFLDVYIYLSACLSVCLSVCLSLTDSAWCRFSTRYASRLLRI